MKKINLFIVAALLSSFSWGQTLLDDFNYATGALLSDNGWIVINGSSTTVNPFTVNSTGLTYPSSPSNGVGFGVNMTTSGQRVGRFVAGITTGTAYMSFLVNVSAAGNSTTVGSNFAGMMNGGSPNPGASARAFIRSSGTGFNFGVGKNLITPATAINYESTVRTFGTTYLVVLKYTYNSGTATDDLVSMWINPALGVVEPAATLTTVAFTTQTDGTSLTGPGFFQRDAASPTCQIDAVRYGTTWAFATPLAVPTLTATPSTPLIIATVPVNTNSPSVSFNLAGTFLTPAPGTITVASSNPAFQVSTDNITFTSSINIANTTATLAAIPVYVRFSSATPGAATVNLTISGGGVAVPPTVTVNAGAGTPFFSNATGSLIVPSNWGTAANGTGTAPADFITDYQIFTIANRTNYTLDDNFQVFGIGSKIVIGDGTNPTKLILPAAFTILNDVDHKVDVSNNATLEIANKIYRSTGPGDLSKTPFPYFGVMDNNSTVEYTWNGTDIIDTVRIPAETFGNLKLKNGLKYFSSGFAFANGTLDITDVVGLNGTGNGSASILVRGNITLSNSFFDTDAFADGNRINLNLGGTGTQTLSGGDFYVGQLRTQAVSPTVPAFALDIILGANSNLITGTTTAGGINLQQPLHNLSLNGKTLTMGGGSSFLGTNQGTISGTSTSNLIVNKTVGTASIGTARFATGGQVLNDFNFNSAGAGTNNLTLNTPLMVNGTLSLNAGNILLGSNTLTVAGSVSGGSLLSHIVTNGTGALKINGVGATTKTFPVGPSATLYHPATLNNSGTLDNFSVNVASVAPPCGDATASVTARWNITEETTGGSNCTISLDYTGAAIGGAYSAAAAKVVDCGGNLPFYNSGSVAGNIATGTGFTSFSPFGITSNLGVLLPVTFTNFSGKRIGKVNKLTWTTVNEQNNLGFEVQRSQDGQVFTKVDFVNTLAPNGSTSDLTYDFIDDNILIGTVQYYRLRQIDNNNRSRNSAIVKIKGEQAAVFTIDGIAPNPVQNNLIASISSPTKNLVNLQVLDMMGRMIQQQQVTIQEGTNVIPVNVSLLGSGIYMLKVIFNDNNQIPAIKFIKQ
jgi:Secretion system C-terminal sorting domain